MAKPESILVEVKDGLRVTLRPAEEGDAAAILRGFDEVGAEEVYIGREGADRDVEEEREFIRSRRRDPHVLLMVAEVEGEVVGLGGVFPGRFGRKDAHVGNLGMWLLAPYRERSIGSAMMEYMLDWARGVGFEKIQLEVFSTNQRAINLYRRYGFEVEGVQRRAFKLKGEYADGLLMGRFLNKTTVWRREHVRKDQAFQWHGQPGFGRGDQQLFGHTIKRARHHPVPQ